MCTRACKGFLFPLRRLVFLSWLLCFGFFFLPCHRMFGRKHVGGS